MLLSKDNVKEFKGIFTIRAIDKDNKTIWSVTEPNMIVNGAREAMSKLVSSGDGNKIITKFGVGTNGSVADPADTELTEPYINDILGCTYPEYGTVTFQWRLDYTEANNKHISEFGLITTDGTLFSRKVRNPIYKAEDIAFEGEWSIIF